MEFKFTYGIYFFIQALGIYKEIYKREGYKGEAFMFCRSPDMQLSV